MNRIFNSLGSNYSFIDVMHALGCILYSPKGSLDILKDELKNEPNDHVVLTYKGRDAIQIACESLLDVESKIVTQAFSCFAVEEGMRRASMVPIYVDIQDKFKSKSQVISTNPSLADIKKRHQEDSEISAVLIQHSLGIPAEIKEIASWCREKNIILIEDLAQAYGAVDADGERLGKYADAVIYSFGRDKILDAVSGGAVVFRNPELKTKKRVIENEKKLTALPRFIFIRDMLYPFFTYWIRFLHAIYFGQLLFVLLKKVGFLTSPVISATNYPVQLHPGYAYLALRKIRNVDIQLAHRRSISQQYLTVINKIVSKKIKLTLTENIIKHASNLRFSVVFDSAETLQKVMSELKKNKVFASDRWYRSAVDSGILNQGTIYKQNSCPNAEDVAKTILNLPTHRYITYADVQKVVKIIDEAVS